MEAEKLTQEAYGESAAAKRGTLVHAWLAGEVDLDGKPIELDDSEQETAGFLQERATDQVHRIFGEEATLELVEKRLWLTINGQKLASGQFDRCVYTPSVALVIDFKTGWAEPDPAEQNSQMKLLAVLVALHMPSMLREVIVQVISGPFGVTEARYDLPALARAYSDILRTLKAIQDPIAPLNPSAEACLYCPAINICQAVKNLIAPVAKTQVSALPDGIRGAKLLDEVTLLEKHLKEIKKYYEKRYNADPIYRLPGYELAPGNEVREVTDWDKAKLRLGEYLDDDQMKEAQSYTIGKLEATLAKSLGITADQAKEKLNHILNGLIVKNQNKSSLKRIKGVPKLVTLELP